MTTKAGQILEIADELFEIIEEKCRVYDEIEIKFRYTKDGLKYKKVIGHYYNEIDIEEDADV